LRALWSQRYGQSCQKVWWRVGPSTRISRPTRAALIRPISIRIYNLELIDILVSNSSFTLSE
jgi:hypothetical protein